MNERNESMGYIEVKSMVAAIEAADSMLKVAYVRLHTTRKVGGGLVCVTVYGDLASCQAAVAAGSFAAKAMNALVQAHVIARPAGDSFDLWTEHIPAMQERKQARKAEKAGRDEPEAAPAAASPAPKRKAGTRS